MRRVLCTPTPRHIVATVCGGQLGSSAILAVHLAGSPWPMSSSVSAADATQLPLSDIVVRTSTIPLGYAKASRLVGRPSRNLAESLMFSRQCPITAIVSHQRLRRSSSSAKAIRPGGLPEWQSCQVGHHIRWPRYVVAWACIERVAYVCSHQTQIGIGNVVDNSVDNRWITTRCVR